MEHTNDNTINMADGNTAYRPKRGRPFADKTTSLVQELKARGNTQRRTAEAMGVDIRTVQRHWNRSVSADS